MTHDSEDLTQSERTVTLARARLHVVEGPVPSADDATDLPPIRLRREFKGLTVADLHTEEVALLLPGQVCSALEHIELGDLAAAERALPGQLATIIEGPGHARSSRVLQAGVAALFAVFVAVTFWLLV